MNTADIIDQARALLSGTNVKVKPGQGGHEREILVNVAGYSADKGDIPMPVVKALKALLPTWLIETRGSRLELHPSGGFSGGYDADIDPATAMKVLASLGAVVTLIPPPVPTKTEEQRQAEKEAFRAAMRAKLEASRARRLAEG